MKSDARKELATMYIEMVPVVVDKMLAMSGYSRYKEYREDLLSEGYVALVKAADRYDPRKGVKFASYASLRIRGVFINMCRKIYKEEQSRVNLDSISEGDLSQAIEDTREERSIGNLIERLEPKNSMPYYEVYYGLILGEDTIKNVAKTLGMSEGSVSNVKRRLLKKLKIQLIKEGL
jgi:RNA polymerase sigma factor (sigma-70 family)